MFPSLHAAAAALGLLTVLVAGTWTAGQTIAPPNPAIVWRTDYDAARWEAVAQNKPLLVVFRCFERPEQAGLETRENKPSDPDVAALVTQGFVPVRVVSFKGIDLDTFRFDYDLQFAALVIDGRDGETLARWGTRDGESATGRVSPADLQNTLNAAARVYQARKPNPKTVSPPRTLTDYPAFAASRRAGEPCYHCHYANDAALADARTRGVFTNALLFRYPLPETIGLTLDKAQSSRVAGVRSGSAAARAGVKAGDILRQANGAPVYSSADLQYGLDRVPDSGRVVLATERAGKQMPRRLLELPQGWRESEDISWRPSQGGVPPFLGTWESPLPTAEKAALGISADRIALRITHLFSGEKWAQTHAGLAVGDIVVACDGQTPPAMGARQFHTWFRLRYKVGDTAHLSVLRGGKKVEVPVPCVDVAWQ